MNTLVSEKAKENEFEPESQTQSGNAGSILNSTRPTILSTPVQRVVSVWLVEDNHRFRRTVARLLNQVDGLECSQNFTNAEDALDALNKGCVPDVILLDVELPGQNGIEAMRTIKSICPSTRVLMLTAFDDHEKVFKAICAGASGYLLKASPLERIVESIQQALEGGAPLNPQVARSVLDMFSKLVNPRHDYGLTEREQEVLELMARGFPKKGIADQLSIRYYTVDSHVKNIYAKLHVHSITEAVACLHNKHVFDKDVAARRD